MGGVICITMYERGGLGVLGFTCVAAILVFVLVWIEKFRDRL